MANAKGSSVGGAAAGHGDLGRTISHDHYQAFLASVHMTAAPGAHHQHHHHRYPAVLIPPPVAMPVHVPVPHPTYSPQIAPPQPFAPPPPEHCTQSQSHPPPGRYQDYSPYGNIASSQHPRGFADWGTQSNALVSLAHATAFSGSSSSNNINTNGIHENFSPYITHTTWTASYVPRNPYGTATYAPAAMNMLQTPFHNNHEKESGAGFATGYTMAQSVVPTSPFQQQLISPRSTNYTPTDIFDFEEDKNLEDASKVFGSGDMESDNSEEPDPAPVSEIQDYSNQENGHIDNMGDTINCQDYRLVLRKDLTNSDVGNIGRIVLPKRDAEPNLPSLEDKDGVIVEMDDFELPAVWKFKYRFWPNNKSRMYILETTGEFVKRHGLQAKDILLIYRNKKSGRYVARAVKSEDIQVPECECMKAGNSSEECGFAVSPSIKKT